jgi:hypothetical protein
MNPDPVHTDGWFYLYLPEHLQGKMDSDMFMGAVLCHNGET